MGKKTQDLETRFFYVKLMSRFFLIHLKCTAQVVLPAKEVTLMIQLILVNIKQCVTSVVNLLYMANEKKLHNCVLSCQ